MTIKPPSHSPRFRAERRSGSKRAVSPPKTCCMKKRGYEQTARGDGRRRDEREIFGGVFHLQMPGLWRLASDQKEATSHDVKQKFNVRDVLTGEEK